MAGYGPLIYGTTSGEGYIYTRPVYQSLFIPIEPYHDPTPTLTSILKYTKLYLDKYFIFHMLRACCELHLILLQNIS